MEPLAQTPEQIERNREEQEFNDRIYRAQTLLGSMVISREQAFDWVFNKIIPTQFDY